MTKLDALLYEFLVEENQMTENEFKTLNEETKTETVIALANDVLHSIQQKMSSIDTLSIDRTRGEIKNFCELQTIQDVVNRLTNMAFSYAENVNPKLPLYLKEITKSIYNLNKYSPQFKDAYRGKKTLLMLRYQSVILSIISSLSYLVSALIDFKDIEHLKLKSNVQLEYILPLQSLKEFNDSIENGSFDAAIRDTQNLREFFIEYDVNQLSTIYEAVDIVNLINTGISSFSNLLDNPKRNSIVFKVLGIVVIILSLRSIFYTLSNSRIKIQDKLQQLKTFLNVDKLSSTSAVAKFITYNNKNAADSVITSKEAVKEIAQENKEIVNDVKNRPSEFEIAGNEFIPEKNENTPDEKIDDIFAEFNF